MTHERDAHEDAGEHEHAVPAVPPGPAPAGWFDDARNKRRFFLGFYVLCALTLLLDLFIPRHAYLSIEGRFGFYAIWGFLSIVILVQIAVLLRKLVMRAEDYYER